MKPVYSLFLVYLMLSKCCGTAVDPSNLVSRGAEKSEGRPFLQWAADTAADVEIPIGRDQEEGTSSIAAKATLEKEDHGKVVDALLRLYSLPPDEHIVATALSSSDAKAHYLAALIWLHAPSEKLMPLIKRRLEYIKFGNVGLVQGQSISAQERDLNLYYIVSEGTKQDLNWVRNYSLEVDQIDAKRGILAHGFLSNNVNEYIDEVRFVRSHTSRNASRDYSAWVVWSICFSAGLGAVMATILGICAFVKSKRHAK